MKPNTFFIGAPKCGTTSVCHYLSEHPNVFFSSPKEPFYWCTDFKDHQLGHEPKYDRIEDYLALFAEADPQSHQVVAEGSTRYLCSRVATRDIISYQPDARFIALVRNPVDLVQSYHMEQVYSLYESDPDFESAWRREINLTELPDPETIFKQYASIANLGSQIQFVQSIVGEDRLHVVVFDDLKESMLDVYNGILEFLDLPSDGRSEFPVLNASHGHRFKWLAKIVLDPPDLLAPSIRKLRFFLSSNRFSVVESLKKKLNRPKERTEISASLSCELQDHFRPEVQKLGQLIGRDLNHWLA